MEKSDLLEDVYKKYSFDEIVDYGLDKHKITSTDILSVAYDYEAPVPDDRSISDICLENIEDEFDKLTIAARKEDKKVSSFLPDAHDIMNLLLSYYDDSELMNCFDNDSLLEHLDGTYELDWHDESVVDAYRREEGMDDEDDDDGYPSDFNKYIEDYVYWKMDHAELREFLCRITDSANYISDEELFSKLKDKINFK